MLSTIVIVPRERFSVLPLTLESLFETIPEDVPVIVYEGNAPEHIRKKVRDIADRRPFELVETDHFLLAPQARNDALEKVRTKYVVYSDNDVTYSPGWLEALEANAEANGSAAVAPLTILGPGPDQAIHHAGSEITIKTDGNGRKILKSLHRLDNVPVEVAIADGFSAAPLDCDEFEYHLAMIRTDVLREIGGHDERQTKHDHLHDSLRILALGHKITFEKDARIIYNARIPFENSDLPYFFYRWSDEGSIQSDRLIGEAWGAPKNYPENALKFVKTHRRRAAATRTPNWVKKLTSGRVRKAVDLAILRLLTARFERIQEPISPKIPPAPPTNGLELAGIRAEST